jgi:hypothetical protein
MTKQNCLPTQTFPLSELTAFEQKAIKAADAYVKSSDMFEGEDKQILLDIAKDKQHHVDIVKDLTRLIEEGSQETPR